MSWDFIDNSEFYKAVGFNPDIDTAVGETVWCIGGSVVWPTQADYLSIVSNNAQDTNLTGTGAWTVGIEGVDGDGYYQSESVELNGLTPVITTKQFYRVNRVRVFQTGTDRVNAGTISLTGQTTLDVFCGVNSGRGLSSQAAFTVPADYKAGYLVRLLLSTAVKGTAVARFELKVRPHELSELTLRIIAVDGTPYEANINPYAALKLSPRTDIFVDAEVSANDTAVFAAFDVLLRR